MKYSQIDQQTSDIDWFFTENEHIAFVASGAGILPTVVASSKNNTEMIAAYFQNLPFTSEAIINADADCILSNTGQQSKKKEYYNYFVTMAKRGLFAFDKTIFNNFSDPLYHLVAIPTKPLYLEDITEKIRDILLDSNTKLNIEHLNSFDVKTDFD